MDDLTDSEVDLKEIVFGPGAKWCIGNANMLNVVRMGFTLPREVIVMDQTLREGEDTPDVCLSFEDKLKIVEKLQEAGVPEIEVGYVGAIDEQYEFTKKLKQVGLEMKLGSHNRTYTKADEWKNEIDRAIDAGVDIINFVGWVSKTMTSTTPWLRSEQVPERIKECVEYSKSRGVVTGWVQADLFGTRLDSTMKCYEAAIDAGADRIYIGDGTGAAIPEAVSFFVRLARDIAGPKAKIALHCHNDFGLATANTLAGVKAGAEIVDVTVNGLGHNSGIAPLEEVVVALAVQYNVQTGVKLEKLYGLSKLVEQLSQVKMSPNKPVVGDNVGRHQLDSHMAGIIQGGKWYTWENIKPEVLARTRRLEWARGKLRRGRSGSIDAKIGQMGLAATDEQVQKIFDVIREALEHKEFMTEAEVESVIKRAIGS